jgi:DNA-binding response OmpR family regulator
MGRMLIVEDDKTTSNLLRSIFTHKGWQVETAGTVLEGLAALDPPPDFLLLDLILPDGDGMDVLKQVRSKALSTHVVVMTSLDPSSLTGIQRLKPDAVLRKPIDADDLMKVCNSQALQAESPFGSGAG